MKLKEVFSVFVGKSGADISYLHKEAVKLDAFGPKVVTRASEVEFDHEGQEWYAVLNNGQEIARDKSRDVVLAQERVVIEQMKAAGLDIPGCGAHS